MNKKIGLLVLLPGHNNKSYSLNFTIDTNHLIFQHIQ